MPALGVSGQAMPSAPTLSTGGDSWDAHTLPPMSPSLACFRHHLHHPNINSTHFTKKMKVLLSFTSSSKRYKMFDVLQFF